MKGRLGNELAEGFGRLLRTGQVGVEQYQGEFLTAPANPDILPVESLIDEPAQSLEHQVAHGVSMIVVDRLEMVDIEQYQAQRYIVYVCVGHVHPEFTLTRVVVEQFGQSVGLGAFLQPS